MLGREALNEGDPARAQALLTYAWERSTADRQPCGDAADDMATAAVHRRMAGPVADTLAILALHRRDGDDVVTWARRSLAVGGGSGISATLLCHGLAIDGRLPGGRHDDVPPRRRSATRPRP